MSKFIFLLICHLLLYSSCSVLGCSPRSNSYLGMLFLWQTEKKNCPNISQIISGFYKSFLANVFLIGQFLSTPVSKDCPRATSLGYLKLAYSLPAYPKELNPFPTDYRVNEDGSFSSLPFPHSKCP